MSEESTITSEISNNKNKQNVRCCYCNSLILKEQQGLYEKSQVSFWTLIKETIPVLQ